MEVAVIIKMGLLDRFKKNLKGNYKAYVKCPNCNFNSEVEVPKGMSVPDFVKGGKCVCDNCGIVFFPNEYTTDFFELEKRKDMQVNVKPKSKDIKSKDEIKKKKLETYKEYEDNKKAMSGDYNIKW